MGILLYKCIWQACFTSTSHQSQLDGKVCCLKFFVTCVYAFFFFFIVFKVGKGSFSVETKWFQRHGCLEIWTEGPILLTLLLLISGTRRQLLMERLVQNIELWWNAPVVTTWQVWIRGPVLEADEAALSSVFTTLASELNHMLCSLAEGATHPLATC